MTRGNWPSAIAAAVLLLSLPLIISCLMSGPLPPANLVFVWWTVTAVLLAALTMWLVLRFKPPMGRAWTPPLAVSVLLASCVTVTFPVALFLLFFSPLITLFWLVAFALTVTGSLFLWRARPLGALVTGAPVAVLGVVALITQHATASRTGSSGAVYITIGGLSALDACFILLIVTVIAVRMGSGSPPEAIRGPGAAATAD